MTKIQSSIQKRYSREVRGEDSLSCGNNLHYARLKPGENVLDLGCGRGSDVLRAAALISPGGRAVGVDLTREMIEAARKRRQAEAVANAEFICAAMEALPLEDNSFDAVLSNCAINHAPDKGAVYKEIFRVLRPGGRCLVSDIVALERLPEEITSDPKAWADCFGGAIPREDYIKAINSAGFTGISILSQREYLKNGYPIASITFEVIK